MKKKKCYIVGNKALSWVGGPKRTQTSDHWGAHLRSDQLNYPLGLYGSAFKNS
jgi:hypothetical protein